MFKEQHSLSHCLSRMVATVVTVAATSTASFAMTFAAVGDFGDIGSGVQDVADLVDSWNPEFVITLGDNDYEGDYRRSVTPYYGDYISSNCSRNRFYPSYGNHDWTGRNGYDDVFPCTPKQYSFVKGDIHFFSINSDSMSSSSARWLRDEMQASNAKWKIVFMHHPPYSSGRHGSQRFMQLDYAGWGADLVLSGHDHLYERIERNGISYVVNGLGGRRAIYDFEECCVSGSRIRYNNNYGAMRFDVNGDTMRVRFITRTPTVRDEFTLRKNSDGGNPDPDPDTGDTYTGTLDKAKDSDIQPNGTWFQYGGGTLEGTLTGPSNADFELYLYKWDGKEWQQVDSSEGSGSSEFIRYQAASGYYYFRVYSYDGGGKYSLKIGK